MTINPLVSICIPAYEYPELLERCLESIVTQSYSNFEVIITDDSSHNKLKEIVEKFKDDRLYYYKNEKPLGSPANWNKAISYAKGELIKIIHHDDWLTNSTSLVSFVEPFNENQNLDFAFSRCINTYKTYQKKFSVNKKLLNKVRKDATLLLFMNVIGAPSTTIYKNAFLKNIVFDENSKWYVDVIFYSRILHSNNAFLYIEKPLVSITSESDTQVTNNTSGSIKVKEALYAFNLFEMLETNSALLFITLIELFKRYEIKSVIEYKDVCNSPKAIKKIALAHRFSKFPIPYKFYTILRHLLIRLT